MFQNACREEGLTREEALIACVRLHVSFARTHSVWDGNGTTARLIANVPVIRAGYLAMISAKEPRQEYIEALSGYHFAVGTVKARSELIAKVTKLDRFKMFCAESWEESMEEELIKLVDEANKKQNERN